MCFLIGRLSAGAMRQAVAGLHLAGRSQLRAAAVPRLLRARLCQRVSRHAAQELAAVLRRLALCLPLAGRGAVH